MLGEDDFDSLLSGGSVSAWIKRKIYSLVSVYFSITPEFSERYRKFYPSKRIFENPQGVDTERFFPVLPDVKTKLRKRMEIPDGLTVLLSVGTPVYRKGYMELFTILSGLTVPFLYVIAGETDVTMSPHLAKKPGEIRDTIANGEKLLGSRVRFTGMVDNLNEWMNIADIFILNSEQEGLPNSLLECLASGTMILMRNIGGLEGYILKDGENAFLYRDGEGFEKTINKLMKDPGSVTDPGNDFARKVRERISMDIVYRDLKKSISEGSGKK